MSAGTPDAPLAEFYFGGGALRGSQLTLYANRIVLQGAGAMETVPLAHLASVRVAFEREPRKLNWMIGLALVALVLAVMAGPLQGWADAAAAQVVEHTRSESGGGGIPAALIVTFRALGGLASVLPAAAAALGAWAAALAVLYWLGLTRLTLSFGATERVYAVRGRDPLLREFAESVGKQLAELR
jgi:hypothetical protein